MLKEMPSDVITQWIAFFKVEAYERDQEQKKLKGMGTFRRGKGFR